MYQKVLVPLDGSKEAEDILPFIQGEVAADGELVLLHIIRPVQMAGHLPRLEFGPYEDIAEHAIALGYLRDVAVRRGGCQLGWRFEVIPAESISQGIIDFAKREGVDMIAMYAGGRKGITRLVKRHIERDTERGAPIRVHAYKTRELTRAA